MYASSRVSAPAFAPQLLRATGPQHLAGVHRREPVEPLGFLHVRGRHEHAHGRRDARGSGRSIPELPARQRIDARGRLVEDEQSGSWMTSGKGRASASSPRRLPAGRSANSVEAGRGEQLSDTPRALLSGLAEQAAEELDVLEHRKGRVEVLAEPLRHVPLVDWRLPTAPPLPSGRPGESRRVGPSPRATRRPAEQRRWAALCS